jgi:integrase/recombinase XerD
VKRYGCAVRSFLRYGHLAGLIETDLSGAVLPMADRRRSLLPQGLTEAQVRALLRSCDRRRAVGRRDYAVIVLMLRLGLRVSEVAALRLDDIDWRAGTVTVHGKKRGWISYRCRPMSATRSPATCGTAGSRVTGRELFVDVTGRQVGLGSRGVSCIVYRGCARAGLAPFGAHRLRHTAACQMLRAGGSLAEIGQVLRHESAQTTAEYACVDVKRLRTIARPWPAGTTS